MFSINKELHPPTGVEMCSYCYFFDRREKNLVVAGSNLIRVFRFVPDQYETTIGKIHALKLCIYELNWLLLINNDVILGYQMSRNLQK